EGAELELLQGARALLRSGQVKQILCEVHAPAVRQADVETFLRNCGFAVNDLGDAGLHACWDETRSHRRPRLFRLGIVGCGAITEIAHLPAASRLDEVELVGLVDNDRPRAQSLASTYGVPLAADRFEALLGQVDGLILATPP